ncbi:hypothetical protein [Ancylobacter polymorphus]|uniref:Uncharacterized protein n=1 Tax=Ancylobacter polymorphus TaxID=223390 RepID=A0A9E7D8M7_9HYPH|nr:hypothetical protein [Ancylobacter polymorphus]UOK73911.1 hypothetical protein K9D25_24660 [Ancylobacter polymorphus]
MPVVNSLGAYTRLTASLFAAGLVGIVVDWMLDYAGLPQPLAFAIGLGAMFATAGMISKLPGLREMRELVGDYRAVAAFCIIMGVIYWVMDASGFFDWAFSQTWS